MHNSSFEVFRLQTSERLLVFKCFAECIPDYIFPVDMGMALSLSAVFYVVIMIFFPISMLNGSFLCGQYEFGLHSCFHENLPLLIARVVLG